MTGTDARRLVVARRVMMDYLEAKVDAEDWHGVMDAAADLREIDAELRGLANANDLNPTTPDRREVDPRQH